MRPEDEVRQQLKRTPVKLNPEVDEAVFSDLFDRLGRGRGTQPVCRVVMSRVAKLAIAAAVVVAALLGIHHLGGSMDGASVAWAEVVRRIERVDHLHFYSIRTEPNGYSSIREGWYAHGKIRTRQYDAEQTIDNGRIWVVMDEHHNVVKKGKSRLAEYDNVFDALTKDVLTYRFSEFENKTPVSIGSDFLLYEFDAQGDEAAWIDKITVTVGRNSLMPVQIKTYFRKGKWSTNHLLVFDYEAAEKPDAFFALPTVAKSPHGVGRIVLGGAEVTIELQNTPGIKKAIVRLHAESKGSAEKPLAKYYKENEPVGDPIAFMEITFVTVEGDRSKTTECPLGLGQGLKGILGMAQAKSDNEHRYIVFTSLLRATDQDNVFELELSCWLKTKRLDQN